MRKMIALLSIFCLLLTACSDGNHAEPGEELGSSSLSLSQPSSGESSAEPSEALGSESSASSPLPAEAVVDHDWQFASPEEHGLDAEVFADMHEALVGTGIHSVVR